MASTIAEVWYVRLQAVCFFVEGDWITVVVDDLIPCDAGGIPIFGRCKDPHHVWVQVGVS